MSRGSPAKWPESNEDSCDLPRWRGPSGPGADSLLGVIYHVGVWEEPIILRRTNADGDVSDGAFLGGEEAFCKLDRDRDGLLSVTEAGRAEIDMTVQSD